MESSILSVAVVGFALLPVLGVRCYGAEPATTQAPWKAHVVGQLNGAAPAIRIPAKLKILTEPWNRVVAMPWMVYMPEKDRLLMLVAVDNPHQAAVLFSDDRGATWSKPRYLHVDAQGKSDIGFSGRLAYLGNGNVVAVTETGRLLSGDYGKTWRVAPDLLPSLPDGKEGRLYGGPNLGDRAPVTGKVTRLVGNGFGVEEGVGQGYIMFSADEASPWTETIKVPQWYGVSEIDLVRAANGDLVAAGRTYRPDRFGREIDHFAGLGTSISKDNGKTWSDVKKLYDWGRHHTSSVVMPNHDIVMTYVVRRGYVRDPTGLKQFGIEAVVSHDHGQTWDLDHRYLLHTWKANRLNHHNDWWASSQGTASVLLPDGSILTAFGTGYRSEEGPDGEPIPRDVGLVLWRLGDQPLNDDRTIRDAPFDSDIRNVFDPAASKAGKK